MNYVRVVLTVIEVLAESSELVAEIEVEIEMFIVWNTKKKKKKKK